MRDRLSLLYWSAGGCVPGNVGEYRWVSLPCITPRHFCLKYSWTAAGWHRLVCSEGSALFTCSLTLPCGPVNVGGCTVAHLWPAAAILHGKDTWPSEAEQFTTSSLASTKHTQQPGGFSSQFPSAMGQGSAGSPFHCFISLWWTWARASATNTTCRGTGYVNGSLAWVCSSVIEEQQVWSHHLWF